MKYVRVKTKQIFLLELLSASGCVLEAHLHTSLLQFEHAAHGSLLKLDYIQIPQWPITSPLQESTCIAKN